METWRNIYIPNHSPLQLSSKGKVRGWRLKGDVFEMYECLILGLVRPYLLLTIKKEPKIFPLHHLELGFYDKKVKS